MPANYDLIIVGGGCAGLSLAMRLSEQNLNCPKVLIIERRDHYVNDRTWCFWCTEDSYLKHLPSHHWETIKIKSAQESSYINCKDTPYLMIEAKVFYEHALQKIAKNNRITIVFNESVVTVPTKTNELWHFVGNDEIYTAKTIVDTRPVKIPQHGDAILWQSFYGYEIECANAVFDRNIATLMDFDDYDKTCVCFNYLLPTSTKKALIEITIFAVHPIPYENLKVKLEKVISRYTANQAYKTIRTEHGILPMGNKPQTNSHDKSYIYAGLFAGAARPSTGYAFQRIQRWADYCAKAIYQTQYPISHQPDSISQTAMDSLFLKLVRARPNLAPTIFIKLFSQCDTPKLIRFLSDKAKLFDYIAVMLALPPAPFLKQLLIGFFEKTIGHATKKTD